MAQDSSHSQQSLDTAPVAAKRDFLILAGNTMAGVGAACFVWPLINSLNPAADTLALATTEVDLAPIQEGMAITIKWRGNPVFIRHRTAKEIEEAKSVDLNNLRDPQADEQRVQKPQWLVMLGVCTHLGCVPLGQKATEPKGDYDGWFCPCHGSHYDSSGRIRKGPAPSNLAVPPYQFVTDARIKIG